jgi:hypothetical protein
MRNATSICVAVGITLIAAVPSYAFHHHRHHKSDRIHVVRVSEPPLPKRVCDWMGPGARVAYRCTYVDPQPPTTFNARFEAVQQPRCGWIGPGGPRAYYACR